MIFFLFKIKIYNLQIYDKILIVTCKIQIKNYNALVCCYQHLANDNLFYINYKYNMLHLKIYTYVFK